MEMLGQLHGYFGMKAQLLVDNGVGGAFWKTLQDGPFTQTGRHGPRR